MVIDELVVQLGLDTKQFTEGQRKALESARKFQDDLEKRMARLADANKKTAYSVQDITAAAEGLFSVLAGAEFGHFVMQTVNGAAATGRMATNIGMASNEVSSFSRMIERNGGDAAAAAGSMKSFVDQVQRLTTYGEASDSFLRGFGRLQETGAKIGESPQDVFLHLADFADKHRGEANMAQQANLIGADLGLNQDLINSAIRGRAAALRDLAEAEKAALSPRQTKNLTDFQHAWRGLTQALTGGAEKGIAETIEPFTKGAEAAGEWARNNQGVVAGLVAIIGSIVGLKAVAGTLGLIARVLAALGFTGAASTLGAAGGAAGAAAGLPARLIKGGGIGGMALGVAGAMKYDSQHGNTWRSWLRAQFGIEDPGEAAPWAGARPSAGGAGGGAFSSQAEKEAFIRQSAAKAGIDPDIAMKVARSEGFNAYTGDNGTSFGAFQLHVTPGGRGRAVGDQFQEMLGLDPRDKSTEREQIMYAMEYVKRHGWGDFHGAANSGIGNWQGVGRTEVNIGSVTVQTNSDDPKAHAKAFTAAVGSRVQGAEGFSRRVAQQANTGNAP